MSIAIEIIHDVYYAIHITSFNSFEICTIQQTNKYKQIHTDTYK